MAKFALRIYRRQEWKELAMCLIYLIIGVANCFDSCNQYLPIPRLRHRMRIKYIWLLDVKNSRAGKKI